MTAERRSEEMLGSTQDRIFRLGYASELFPLVLLGATGVVLVLLYTYYFNDFVELK